MEAAAGDDDVPRPERPVRRAHEIEAGGVGCHFDHRLAGMDGQAMPRRVILQQGDELVPAHRPLGIAAVIAVTGHHGQHARDVEVKAVPPLRAPGFAYSPAFEHQVGDARRLQPPADAEPGPAGPDYHHVKVIAHAEPPDAAPPF